MSGVNETNPESPTMAKVIQDAIEARLIDVHTAMPGMIVSYDPSKQMAQVQPSLKKKYSNGTIVPLPIINNVTVVHPRGGTAAILLPLKAGDPCWLIFGERSLDNWKSQGGISDPADTRKHHLSDAVCIPGGSSFSQAIAGDASDFIFQNDQCEFRLKSAGTFSLKNKAAGNELIDLLVQLLTALVATQTLTALGPQPFVNNADYVALKTKFTSLKV